MANSNRTRWIVAYSFNTVFSSDGRVYTMTRGEALKELHDCRITSLGEFTYGYVLYEETAKIILNKVVDSLEAKIAELEAPKLCGNCSKCIISCGVLVCSDTEFETSTTLDTVCFIGYEPKDTK